MSVSPNPIAIGANPAARTSSATTVPPVVAALDVSVAPRIINKNAAVITTSVTITASILYFPGDASP
jgi:hypothetical protein